MRKFTLAIILFLCAGILSSNLAMADSSPAPTTAVWTKESFDLKITTTINSFHKFQADLKIYYSPDFANLDYKFAISPTYNFDPPQYYPNDQSNSIMFDKFNDRIQGAYQAENKNFSWQRFTIPESFSGGSYTSLDKYEDAYSNLITPIMIPLWNAMDKVAPDGSGYGYHYEHIFPAAINFIPSDGPGNYKRLHFYAKVLQGFVEMEIPTIKKANVEVNPNAWIAQCDAQSTSITKTFSELRGIISDLGILIKSEANNPNVTDRSSNLTIVGDKVKTIRKQIDIYLMKLPVYFKQLPKCVIYSDQLTEAQSISLQLNQLENQLKSFSTNNTVSKKAYNEATFDKSIAKLDSNIVNAKNSAVVTSTMITKSDQKLPIVCIKKSNKQILTLDGIKCPSGYTKKN